MDMAADVVGIIVDALEAFVGGAGASLNTLFSTVIYNATTGLTPLATWMLVFLGFGIGLALFTAIIRKVL